MALILASRSPARAALLQAAGYRFRRVAAASAEPPPDSGISVRRHVRDMARRKAERVGRRFKAAYIVACDTGIEFEGRLIGKPASAGDAVRILRRLAGRTHAIHTGVCVLGPEKDGRRPSRSGVDTASVTLRRRSETSIRRYVRSVRALGCAGGYALQAGGTALIKRVEGDPATVVGLPVRLVERFLRQLGYAGA